MQTKSSRLVRFLSLALSMLHSAINSEEYEREATHPHHAFRHSAHCAFVGGFDNQLPTDVSVRSAIM